MNGLFDDDPESQPGFRQTLVGRPSSADGLAELLLQGLPRPGSETAASDSGYLRDALLALQHPDIESSVPVHLPTFAPPAVGASTAQAAVLTGAPSASTMTDQAIVRGMIDSQRPDLGVEGDLIRWAVPGTFPKDVFENYWQGRGPMQLSDARFADIANAASHLKPNGDGTTVMSVTGQPLVRKQFSFGGPEYKKAVGTASLFYGENGMPVGFYDKYNFDPSAGKRGFLPEVETRIMHWLPKPSTARPFDVSYGTYVSPN